MMAEEEGKVTCELLLRFASADSAGTVFDAVGQDNAGYVDARLEHDSIVATMNARTLKSLLHTLDDFLSCVSVAEKIATKD